MLSRGSVFAVVDFYNLRVKTFISNVAWTLWWFEWETHQRCWSPVGDVWEILKPLTVGTLVQKVGVALRLYNLAQVPVLWLSVPRVPWKVWLASFTLLSSSSRATMPPPSCWKVKINAVSPLPSKVLLSMVFITSTEKQLMQMLKTSSPPF